MRYQGKITQWKDGQGFGFITPNGGGERVFLHIKAFGQGGRRPVEGDIVTYELTADAKGRARAVGVAFVDVRSRGARPVGNGRGGGLPLLVLAFFGLLGALVLTGRLPLMVLGLYAGASLLAFAVYAWDKAAAQGGHWRTAENTLHMIALCGGWPGALVAQRVLRHKSSKASFQVGFWATVLINCGGLGWLLTPAGAALQMGLLGR
ncbi:MAG: DNA-binding protein [Proteobacteria bacterium]|nr:DNA-binding protein [Pseudomonadota bacterium]